MQLALARAYFAVMVGVVLAWNANAETAGTIFTGTAFLYWSAASIGLGLLTRRAFALLLPLLAVPIAIPFGC